MSETVHLVAIHPGELSRIAIETMGAMQKVGELAVLFSRVLELRPEVIVEIGIGKGGTSWAWSKISSVKQIIAIDMPNGPWGGGPSDEKIQYIKDNSHCPYNYIAGDSKDGCVFSKVKDYLSITGGNIDFLFIDGDHSYEGVRADYELYSPLVRKGGLIAFHDICEHPPETGCEVRKFWYELIHPSNSLAAHTIISEPTNWGGIGFIIK